MSAPFDLIVIGGGPAGYTGAIRAAQLGFKVALVEKRRELGGTCLNIGCIPSKALLDTSEHFAHASHGLAKHGVLIEGLRFDLPTAMKRKETVVRQLTTGLDGLMKKNKIERVLGTASLGGVEGDLKVVTVAGEGGATQKLLATRVLLCTGSVPAELPALKFDGKRIVSSTEALSFPQIPAKLLVVGAGAIGLELGSVWRRLGTEVTVIEFQERVAPILDAQVSKDLQRSLEKQGMKFRLATQCVGAKVDANSVTVELEDRATKKKDTLAADYVLVATGRKPYTEGLGLENLGVKKDERGFILTDTHFETSVKGLFAVGDCVPGPMLAHKAEEEAVAAVEIMAGQAGHVNYKAIPSVIYTAPEVASVGETEEELKKRNADYKAGSFPFLANARAKALEQTEGFVKILADAKTDRVLGVHIMGPWASDLIAEAVTVMEFGGSSEDIARTCHAHPTLTEVVKEAALAVHGRKINM